MVTLALSVVPCCTINAKEKQQQEASITPNTKSPGEKDDCCRRQCTPFCTCGSCSGCIITGPSLFRMASLQQLTVIQSSNYQHPVIEEITSDIWQPPQNKVIPFYGR
jgi:hypothetical protein